MFDMTQREDNENNNLLSYAVTNNFSVLFGSKAETKSRIYNPFPIKFKQLLNIGSISFVIVDVLYIAVLVR